MRHFIIGFTALFVCGIRELAIAQWTTTGQFSSINSGNGDGSYPTSINTLGDARFSIGANWTGGATDLSLINSNIANTSGGGFSFWQMMSANSKKMLAYMKGDGSVGFGGIIPTRSLEVRGVNPIFRIGNSTLQNTQVNTVIGGIEFPTSGENAWMAKINANVGAFSDQPYLTFHTGSTSAEQVRIAPNGNVGIGNSSPANKLSVNGDIYSRGHMWLYAYEGESSSGTAFLQARNYAAGTNLDLQLRTQNAGQVVDAVRISSTGNVGIGTITPTALLHVNGNYRTEGSSSQGWPGTFSIDAAGVVGGRFMILDNGNVGIGTTTPGDYKLAVEGKIGAREVEVKVGSWADFVFQPGYQLRPLAEVAAYVATHKHLPEIPSEAEVKANGIGLGEMNAKLLQKIEEMTLYMIEQQKQIDQLKELLVPRKTNK